MSKIDPAYYAICFEFLNGRGINDGPCDGLKEAFDQARKIDPINGANNLFLQMISDITFFVFIDVDIVNCMIEMGSDPKSFDRTENLCINLLEPCSKVAGPDILRLLLEHGLKLDHNNVKSLVRRGKYIEVLLDYFDLKTILEQIADKVFVDFDPDIAQVIVNQIRKVDFKLEQQRLSNLLRTVIYHGIRTTDILEDFINVGLDPRHNNNEIFVDVCRYKDTTLPQYLINNYEININAHDGWALTYALCYGCADTINLLLKSNVKILDNHIKLAVDTGHGEVLARSGLIDYEHLARIFIQKRLLNNNENRSLATMLVTNGIDFSRLILEESPMNKIEINSH